MKTFIIRYQLWDRTAAVWTQHTYELQASGIRAARNEASAVIASFYRRQPDTFKILSVTEKGKE